MNTHLLTTEDLAEQLAKATQAEKRARATAARIRRTMVAVDRKLDTQRKATLGGLLLRAVANQPDRLPELRNLLLPLVTRETDWTALDSTPFRRDLNDVRP